MNAVEFARNAGIALVASPVLVGLVIIVRAIFWHGR